MMNQVKTPAEIVAIRESGRMLAHVLAYLAPLTVPGVTTGELNRLAAAELQRLGGKPAFLGYQDFPAVICISVNDELVHGIPGARVIAEGDIVGLDFGVNYGGMITDGAITVPVGKVSADARRLLKATSEALELGIARVQAGARIGDISSAIEARLRKDKLGVVEDLSGHGVGHMVHEDPLIVNFGRAGTGMRLKAGMTIAIEPMATLGTKEIMLLTDDWTISTADGSLGAQFEHTVLVTDTGYEILTQLS
jgi:methionyl aminopeptidase